ncbi:putative hydrolase [Symmachiella dynata]|uniref:dienelactone hydrolase family protein n=1 Tax=Symmachiella dynata TaxID=2527995 RepID=UPI00118C54AC|nr:dienelactone hydrolase family protein [Symmachiella dynata]QDT50538.1 putative hydrolase [Symmachiella dynata]
MASSTFFSNGRSISGEVFSPSAGSAFPSVVVAYGTEAMRDPFGVIIRDFCSELTNHGMIALVPDYFSSTGTAPGFESVFSKKDAQSRFDHWTAVLNDAVAHVQTISGAASGRTAFVGFSLGGHLVLRAAVGPSVKAVVDFFGPLAPIPQSVILQSGVGNLPPVQIHHGEDDEVVRITNSVTLDGWLTAHSVSHEFHHYPQNGHPGQEKLKPPGWSTHSQTAATALAIRFLKDTI